MRRATSILGILLCLATPGASASDMLIEGFRAAHWRVQINGLSRHFVDEDRREELREVNTGLGIEAQFTDGWFANVGTYQDSYDGDAIYLGGGRRWRLAGGDRYYLDAGLVGFLTLRKWEQDDTDRRWAPGILPLLTVGLGPLELNALFIPEIDGYLEDAPTAFLQASLPIN